MDGSEVCFTWMEHGENMLSAAKEILEEDCYVDCSLVVEGRKFQVHKLLLSCCSPFFSKILGECNSEHPVITLDGYTAQEIELLIEFIYKGEVLVSTDLLGDFFHTTKTLQIVGLSDMKIECDDDDDELENSQSSDEPNSTINANFTFVEDVSQSLLEGEEQRIILNDITKLGVGFENNFNNIEEEKSEEEEDTSFSLEHILVPGAEYSEDMSMHLDEGIERIKVIKEEAVDEDYEPEVKKQKAPKIFYFKVDEDCSSDDVDSKQGLKYLTGESTADMKSFSSVIFQTVKSNNRVVLKRPKTDKIYAKEELDPNNKKMYVCLKCGNRYSHRRTLLHHIHWICDQPATYACNLCSYMGKRKFQLKSHMKHAHSSSLYKLE